MSSDSSNWNTWGYHPCGGDNHSAISSSWVNTLLQLLFGGSGKKSDAEAAFPKIAKGHNHTNQTNQSFPVSKTILKKIPFTTSSLHAYSSELNLLFPYI